MMDIRFNEQCFVSEFFQNYKLGSSYQGYSQVPHPIPLVRLGREPDRVGEAADHHYQRLMSDVVG